MPRHAATSIIAVNCHTAHLLTATFVSSWASVGCLKRTLHSYPTSGGATVVLTSGSCQAIRSVQLLATATCSPHASLALQYACGLLYFTGSDELNKTMRRKAIDMHMKLSEYSLR